MYICTIGEWKFILVETYMTFILYFYLNSRIMQKFKIFQTQQTPKIFIVISAATNSKTCGHMCICCKQQWIRAVLFLKWKWKVLDSIYHKMPLLKPRFQGFSVTWTWGVYWKTIPSLIFLWRYNVMYKSSQLGRSALRKQFVYKNPYHWLYNWFIFLKKKQITNVLIYLWRSTVKATHWFDLLMKS